MSLSKSPFCERLQENTCFFYVIILKLLLNAIILLLWSWKRHLFPNISQKIMVKYSYIICKKKIMFLQFEDITSYFVFIFRFPESMLRVKSLIFHCNFKLYCFFLVFLCYLIRQDRRKLFENFSLTNTKYYVISYYDFLVTGHNGHQNLWYQECRVSVFRSTCLHHYATCQSIFVSTKVKSCPTNKWNLIYCLPLCAELSQSLPTLKREKGTIHDESVQFWERKHIVMISLIFYLLDIY